MRFGTFKKKKKKEIKIGVYIINEKLFSDRKKKKTTKN